MTFRNIRAVAHSICANQRSLYSGRKYGAIVTAGLHSPQSRLYSQYVFPNRGHNTFMVNRDIFCKNSFSRKFPIIPASSAVAHHAQSAWRRLTHMYSRNSRTNLAISRTAQAFSLALSRSYMVVPGLFAWTCGNLAISSSISRNRPIPYKENLVHACLRWPCFCDLITA